MRRLPGLIGLTPYTGALFLLVFFALLVRLVLIPNPGFEADVSFWKSWSMAANDGGIVWSMHNTNNNYPTPFAYILWAMGKVYRLAADPHNFNQYWTNTNAWFLTVAKLPAILADFGILAIILWIGKHALRLAFPKFPRSFYLLLGALYLLNPVSIIDGAWWGQVDSVGVLIFLLAIIAVLTKRPLLAGIIYMIAMMTKLQNMIYGPLFFLFLWQQLGFVGLARGLTGAVLAFMGLNIEFFLSRDMQTVIASLTQNYDYFPLLSLNAYNLWWIVAEGQGMQVSDKISAVGIANAKSVGLMLFSASYLLAMILLAFPTLTRMLKRNSKVRETLPTQSAAGAQLEAVYRFISALIVVAGAFFLFQTQSHDRYAFPISVFLLLWAPFFIYFARPKDYLNWMARQKTKIFLVCYAIFSLLYFYNLHTALVANYPGNAMPGLRNLTQPSFTIAVSFLQLGLFGLFLVTIKRQARPIAYFVSLTALGFMLFSANQPLIFKRPVDLSRLTPIVAQQGYGVRMNDMPVNASLGIKSWTPLSVQYAFYRKGVGTHANSVLDYDINRQFTRFTSDYGIDTEAGGQGSATFQIYGDGRLLFASNKIGRYDLPRHVEIDISGVKRFGLVTTDAGDGINDDHTDWLNPQLWP